MKARKPLSMNFMQYCQKTNLIFIKIYYVSLCDYVVS